DNLALVQSLNRIGAQVAHQIVRGHFKQSLKSSNKTYAVLDGSGLKALAGDSRQSVAGPELNLLLQRQATLEERVSLGIGNCSEMALLATVIARHLGIKANIWGHRVANEISHEFCIVG